MSAFRELIVCVQETKASPGGPGAVGRRSWPCTEGAVPQNLISLPLPREAEVSVGGGHLELGDGGRVGGPRVDTCRRVGLGCPQLRQGRGAPSVPLLPPRPAHHAFGSRTPGESRASVKWGFTYRGGH